MGGGVSQATGAPKATRDEDAPKFMRKINNTRKPSITSTLGVNGITDPSELIEPLEDEGQNSTPNPTKKKGGGKAGGGKRGAPSPTGSLPQSSPVASSSNVSQSGAKKTILVQMSREWIEANLAKSVGDVLARSILVNYSRHLFFCPAYHPSGSPGAHMQAKLKNLPADQHAKHDALHYDEAEVRAAVNKRKESLRKKHGVLTSLKVES